MVSTSLSNSYTLLFVFQSDSSSSKVTCKRRTFSSPCSLPPACIYPLAHPILFLHLCTSYNPLLLGSIDGRVTWKRRFKLDIDLFVIFTSHVIFSVSNHSMFALINLRKLIAKLVIISNNCPPLRKSEIEYYAMLAKCGVYHYNGNNIGLGTAAGKYFRVSSLVITNPGTLKGFLRIASLISLFFRFWPFLTVHFRLFPHYR